MKCSFCLQQANVDNPLVAGPGAVICRNCARRALAVTDGGSPTDAGDAVDVFSGDMSGLTDAQIAEHLAEIQQVSAQTEAYLARWVRELKRRGKSWQAIGDALGMRRQSAWERFRDRE